MRLKHMENISQEQIDAVLSKVSTIKDVIAKVDEMMTDLDKCSGNSTKNLIMSAVKKQLSAIGIGI